MDPLSIVGLVLGSSVLGALVTALFTKRSHEEAISLKYVTEERAKWRDKVRELVSDLSVAVQLPIGNDERVKEVRKLSSYLKVSLNPEPSHKIDSEILECLRKLCETPSYDKFIELEMLVSLLLKHDWERAKNEANSQFPLLLIMSALVVLTWLVVKFVLHETLIYKALQDIKLLSGSYSELAASLVIIFTVLWGMCFIVRGVKNKWLELNMGKLNS